MRPRPRGGVISSHTVNHYVEAKKIKPVRLVRRVSRRTISLRLRHKLTPCYGVYPPKGLPYFKMICARRPIACLAVGQLSEPRLKAGSSAHGGGRLLAAALVVFSPGCSLRMHLIAGFIILARGASPRRAAPQSASLIGLTEASRYFVLQP
jgi:hypothetical protein